MWWKNRWHIDRRTVCYHTAGVLISHYLWASKSFGSGWIWLVFITTSFPCWMNEQPVQAWQADFPYTSAHATGGLWLSGMTGFSLALSELTGVVMCAQTKTSLNWVELKTYNRSVDQETNILETILIIISNFSSIKIYILISSFSFSHVMYTEYLWKANSQIFY